MRYITVEDLSFQYDSEPVLEGINYHLDSGEFVTLTGENGAAKSTLVKARNFVLPICHSRLLVLMLVFRQRFMNSSVLVDTLEMVGFVV